jgi:hypothetical protein
MKRRRRNPGQTSGAVDTFMAVSVGILVLWTIFYVEHPS